MGNFIHILALEDQFCFMYGLIIVKGYLGGSTALVTNFKRMKFTQNRNTHAICKSVFKVFHIIIRSYMNLVYLSDIFDQGKGVL